MGYQKQVWRFCVRNRIEIFYESIIEVLLNEVRVPPNRIKEEWDIDLLIDWLDSSQGYEFWSWIFFGAVLNENSLRRFISILSKNCALPTEKIAVFSLES